MVVGGGGGGGGGGGTSSRRHYWGLLVGLALCCSALYLLLYYRVSLATSSSSILFSPSTAYRSLFLRGNSGNSSSPPPPSSPTPSSRLSPSLLSPSQSLQHQRDRTVVSSSNTSSFEATKNASTSDSKLKQDGGGGGDVPLLTLFSTWVSRGDLKLVRKLTLRNWAQLRPLVRPLLFSNDSAMVEQARQSGWETLPVSRTAIGVPILKNMYLDAMSRFNSTLYAFANGDILFTDGLLKSLTAILGDPALPLREHPLMVIGQRSNVAGVRDEEALNFKNIYQVAQRRGKLFTVMAEDFFITDRKFPWDSIPGVVVGRVAYDNWVVMHAIQKQHVVVDITKSSPAVHQTTGKGNYEGFTHTNSSYNDNVLKRLYKRIHYMGGCVDCAPWRTLLNSEGKVVVEKKAKRPKHC